MSNNEPSNSIPKGSTEGSPHHSDAVNLSLSLDFDPLNFQLNESTDSNKKNMSNMDLLLSEEPELENHSSDSNTISPSSPCVNNDIEQNSCNQELTDNDWTTVSQCTATDNLKSSPEDNSDCLLVEPIDCDNVHEIVTSSVDGLLDNVDLINATPADVVDFISESKSGYVENLLDEVVHEKEVENLCDLENERLSSPASEKSNPIENSQDDSNLFFCEDSITEEDMQREEKIYKSEMQLEMKRGKVPPPKADSPPPVFSPPPVQASTPTPEPPPAPLEPVIVVETKVNGVHEEPKLVSYEDDTSSFNDDSFERHESEFENSISVEDLRTTYKNHTNSQDDSNNSFKEIAVTNVDIKELQSSFSDLRDENFPREIAETGISVKNLKTSFSEDCNGVEPHHEPPEVKPSVNRAEVAKTLNQAAKEDECLCKICNNLVYPVEKVKAERNIFHKNCFRCKECNKLLKADTYLSHEGVIYCKVHHRQLFQPKVKFEDSDKVPKRQRREMIIRENTPAELPPDVVRCDTKSNYHIDSLPDLHDLKNRFENQKQEGTKAMTAQIHLQKSESIMQRMAKYNSAVQGQGDENDSSSDEDDEGSTTIIRESRHKEKMSFVPMNELKNHWEDGGSYTSLREREKERKDELTRLRQRMLLGRSESMRAVYEKACEDSSRTAAGRSESVNLGRDIRAVMIKEKFERGQVLTEEEMEKLEKTKREKEDDLSVFTDAETAVGARNMFKQIDTDLKKSPTSSPLKSPRNDYKKQNGISHSPTAPEVVKCSEPVAKEEIVVETSELTEKFNFFENFKVEQKERKRFQMTPPPEDAKEKTNNPEIPTDPNLIRSGDFMEDIPVMDTARKMLDKFRALETTTDKQSVPSGLKPLKRITPPREINPSPQKNGHNGHHHEASPEPQHDPNIVRCSYKVEDDISFETDKAKSLREKFERWEAEENGDNKLNDEEDYLPQIDTTKNLRAKFEAIQEESLKNMEKPKPRISRFIMW